MTDEDGSVSEGILEKAFKHKVDLIVVGTTGASQIKEFLLGSTPKALIQKATCPVLVVPKDFKGTAIHRMVYATDFEQADIFAINELVNIAETLGAEIRVVHITSKKEYAGKEHMEWFKEMLNEKVHYDHIAFDLLFSEEIFESIVDYIKDSDADLLAMLERKESTFYQKYFEKDMVKKMVNNISVPLLSFNARGL